MVDLSASYQLTCLALFYRPDMLHLLALVVDDVGG